ncbi:MAG: hypothetical protein IJF04_02065 [Oscillospiraceae bacterium]|nr:hypothetical protein [Oscillospiraceae bacterium]MBQ6801957.1 hypothetical protein [Oscillospiraceae bacterium]
MERKNNKTIWYIAALALLLCLGTIVVSFEESFARYQKTQERELEFSVKAREQVYVGTLADESFIAGADLEWQDVGENKKRLAIAVANAEEESQNSFYPQEDKKITINLLATAGFYNAEVKLVFTDENGEESFIEAKSEDIEENSALDNSFGAGVIFRFFDENEEEIFWILEGEKFSCKEIIIEADFTDTDLAIIQPQIIVEPVE